MKKKEKTLGEVLFSKKKYEERMKNVLYIKFKGKRYLLVGDLASGGAITTQEAYDNFKVSHAHLYPDGKIRRFESIIGNRNDIEVLEKGAKNENKNNAIV